MNDTDKERRKHRPAASLPGLNQTSSHSDADFYVGIVIGVFWLINTIPA